MADLGALRGFFGGAQADLKRAMEAFINYGFKNIRVGLPGHQKPAENLAWTQLDGVTSTTANQEFTIAHGQQVAPRVLFPCMDLTSSGTQMIALYATRPADARRLYFRSPSTNAAFTVFIERRD